MSGKTPGHEGQGQQQAAVDQQRSQRGSGAGDQHGGGHREPHEPEPEGSGAQEGGRVGEGAQGDHQPHRDPDGEQDRVHQVAGRFGRHLRSSFEARGREVAPLGQPWLGTVVSVQELRGQTLISFSE